jgi:hypothetical protein
MIDINVAKINENHIRDFSKYFKSRDIALFQTDESSR